MADVSPIRPVSDDRSSSAGEDEPLRPPLAKRPNFDLGNTLVHPSRLLVEGPSGSVQLERRMMEVLQAFADADGAVLSREDLMALCWPGVIVGDDAVNRVIGGLRKAAVEVGGDFTIETVPRIGYRLQTEGAGPSILNNGADEQPAIDAPMPTISRRWLLAGGTAALSAGGIAFWVTRSPPPDSGVAQLIGDADAALQLGTPKMDRQAITLLERSVALSPSSAESWGKLALARARADEHAAPDGKFLPVIEVEKAARRALALDQGNADAKAALAIAIPYYGDWLAAERRFDAVLAKHPEHLVARTSRAFLFGAVGRMRDAANERLVPSRDVPFDANIQYGRIYALWFLGRIEEADRVASRSMQMWPRNGSVWFARLWVLADTGRFDRALVQIDDEAARPPLPPPIFATLRAAMGAARSKKPAEIDAATELVMASVGQSVAAVINAMMVLNLMGATDRAFDLARAYYLEQGPIIAALQTRPGDEVVPDQRRRKTNMLFTPTAAAMRRDPRFLPLVKQMGLADYWDRRGIAPDFLT